MTAINDLKEYFIEIKRLNYINALLSWDQQTYMPNGSISGDGLGLTIVRRIVDRNNGHITLESESGSGSRFKVSLPK